MSSRKEEDASLYETSLKFAIDVRRDYESYNPTARSHELVAAAKASPMCLVLGAGVSIPMKLPSWKQLNRTLLSRLFPSLSVRDRDAFLKNVDAGPILTRFMETEFHLQPLLRREVRDALYEQHPKRETTATISAIVDLLDPRIIGRDRRISEVITYNFDDLLERAAARRRPRIRFTSVYSSNMPSRGAAEIPIFHPHGFLPQQTNEELWESQEPLVFSETEYVNQSFDLSGWANRVQVEAFSTRTCLFLGLSFTDPNLRRLLQLTGARTAGDKMIAASRRFAVMRRNGTASPKRDKLHNYFTERDLLSLGVTTVWINSFERDLPKLLRSLR